ncbi:unnamed protein product [Brassica rapa]|uniref:Peptidase A1 domain-containing protein n=1 Tax=Brassica campestris TaxID=3711 RepID=A0A8D9LXJ0_BRACM|nr:unnamed protein product [Brassica rapa]
MARLFILNVFFVLVATTTSLTEHNPKSLSQDQSKTLMLLYFRSLKTPKPLWTLEAQPYGSSATSLAITQPTTPLFSVGPTAANKLKISASLHCMGTYGPPCRNDTCHAYLQTQMTYNTVLASLVKDDVVLSYTSPSTKLAARLPLACMSASEVVAGLPYGTQGILGLGNSSTSSVKVMVSSYKIPFKVALCLPCKPGNDFGPVYIGPPNRKDVRRLLVSTSLVSIPETRERGEDNYYIDTSHWGGTKIPYTLLETSIYKALVKAFVGKAQKRKAVYPFTDCFSLKILEENLCFTSLKT